ncbi:flagellar basal body protein [Rubrivirga sp. S365]|uniref:Flagellar basal body protein n=1 Tax=Rubrivirga litoralis TaxID=3075598 RepID=A0ABU3BSS7_9BACT|nr:MULTISPECIES: flagellar basal body protein [unclassified Rubrivirga]MDT0632356.1 flagellar basal body protein [Rubrivirga sp. F394]MDT7857322.1 flagellar basal body protein [Rubrivirga sp. S365]
MDTPKFQILRQAMNAYALRTRALATNVSNLDTPGFQRVSVSFEDALQRARRGPGGVQDASALRVRAQTEDRPPLLEDEMMELADTQMRTQLATRALSEHFSLMRTSVTGRPE